MSGPKPEFDGLSGNYEELLRDPLRDRFTGQAGEFFHARKRDLILDYFRRRRIETRGLSFLDVGCGKGELVTLLRDDFARVAGCDPSAGMLEGGGLASKGIEVRIQADSQKIPFEDRQFDFVTAVCVYHHVPPALRDNLTSGIRRVLKPAGVFAIIEHNPYNPVTKLITSRTPVDADAILLRRAEARALLRRAGFRIDDQPFFLYLPERLYRRFGGLESVLKRVPLGGQYAIFGRAGGDPDR